MKQFHLLIVCILFLLFSELASATSGCPGNETCSGHGVCFVGESTCICDPGYLSLPEKPACSYAQKKWICAFCYQFGLGFSGAAFWYIERYAYASGQLILSLSLVPLGIATWSVWTADKAAKRTMALVTALTITDFLGGLVWWAVDINRFINDEITDGNGQRLFAKRLGD